MKKNMHLRQIISLVLAFALIFTTVAVSPTKVYAATKTIKVTGKYYQSSARKMKKMINEFRTGDEAWYYEKEGSKKKVKCKDLGKLSYDYKLEKVAMKRAVEISVLWSHTRPNGESCFSLYPSGYMAMGENLAMGPNTIMDAKYSLELLKENDEPYSGQGHRRNMLNENYTCVGIACFEVDGIKYWVQEFGSPKSSAKKTKACNKKKTIKVEVYK